MSSFDNAVNEDLDSANVSPGGVQAGNNRLVENSALREAENEVIRIITKVRRP